MLGEYRAAVACCRQALDLYREVANPLGEAHAWDHLGFAWQQLGDGASAMACYRRALGLLREVKDWPEQAAVLTRLGATYWTAGNLKMARAAWRQALTILDELHDVSADDVRSRLDRPALQAASGLS
jgi:tetratricopeptide (TPR) repeat protein